MKLSQEELDEHFQIFAEALRKHNELSTQKVRELLGYVADSEYNDFKAYMRNRPNEKNHPCVRHGIKVFYVEKPSPGAWVHITSGEQMMHIIQQVARHQYADLRDVHQKVIVPLGWADKRAQSFIEHAMGMFTHAAGMAEALLNT